jgi:hypothetical protein
VSADARSSGRELCATGLSAIRSSAGADRHGRPPSVAEPERFRVRPLTPSVRTTRLRGSAFQRSLAPLRSFCLSVSGGRLRLRRQANAPALSRNGYLGRRDHASVWQALPSDSDEDSECERRSPPRRWPIGCLGGRGSRPTIGQAVCVPAGTRTGPSSLPSSTQAVGRASASAASVS